VSEPSLKRVVLDQKTLVPLGIFVTSLTMLVGFSMWIDDKFDGLDKRMEKIEELLVDQWKVSDQELWAERLKSNNPTIAVPHVRRP
jgi:hypothetical protein